MLHASEGRHTLPKWGGDQATFTFNLPELQNPEVSLVGGRLVYVGQSPGAELLYLIRRHQVSVFIFQERAVGHLPKSDSTLQRQQETFGFRSWSQNGLHYFVVGGVAGDDLSKIADLFRNAGRS